MKFNAFKLEMGEISLLTFNRPGVNLFSTEVLKDFIRALKALHSSKDIRVLVITGEGKTFLAGADIKELSTFTTVEAERFSRLFHEAMDLVEGLPRPVIAAVNGFALGGGCELILACDMVIASEAAVFGTPEINIGIIPGAGGTQRLASRVGRLRAKELIFTGRRTSANEAVAMGLINKVVPKEKLLEDVMALARTVASKPTQCLEATKALIDHGTLDKEVEAFSRMFSYEDRERLMKEFIKKR
ncbi:MAG: enoyl-CoA hydratase-related protein [Thermodesulfobacteriota bacterium]|nr:MAG: enoyl-CoA hydratase-related protein [Thermodesulfobacteriota bacterium]